MNSPPDHDPAPWDLDARPLLQIPTMVSQHELRYLRWLGRTHWDGHSHAIEFGPWLGATTAALAQGMLENPNRVGGRLHTYDSFRWRPFMDSRAGFTLTPGTTFRPHFASNVSLFSGVITDHECSLPDDPRHFSAWRSGEPTTESGSPFQWPSGDPIGILFLDGAKSWTALLHILRECADAVIPGETLLVCQDYRDPFAFWHPLLLEMLADSLSLEHVLPSDTCTFRVMAPISARVSQLPSFGLLAADQAAAAVDRAADQLARSSADGAVLVRLGTAVMLAAMEHWEMSEHRYAEIAHCTQSASVVRAVSLFEEAFRLHRGRFPRAGWRPRHRRLQSRFPSYRRLARVVRRTFPL